jgi:hypothetical protein
MTALAEAPAFQAGVYDISEEVYFGDPVPTGSLSCSGAKKLLPPNCPALFFWERDHPVFKDDFDFGSAAHKLVLGSGPELVVIDKPNWQTNAAKEARKEAREAGKTPILIGALAEVQAMADAIRRHPVASVLFDPSLGNPEQSLFWEDTTSGIWRRCRLDWLPDRRGGRLIIPDYKTAVSANPASFAKPAANYGYHQQHDWYVEGVSEVLGVTPEFVFVVQEKTPPYLISVIQLNWEFVRAGRELNRKAIGIYQDCIETGEWPGYSDEIELISPPAWARPRGDYF